MYQIIEVTTPTCSVCKMIKPMIEKVISSYPTVKFNVFDHEEEGAKFFLEKYNLKTVPAFFFIREGEIVNTHFGAITLPDFKKKIESLINEG